MLLVVAATERELAFVEGAETLCCGVGPVESALQTARSLAGPAGLRSDNLALDVVEFRAPLARDPGSCHRDETD